MSSLKDAASLNNSDMSVTPEVCHLEMGPYVASAAVAFESHAAMAVRILESSMKLCCVGAGVGNGQSTPWSTTPHDVDAHGVPENASSRFTSLPMHQPRSWSKAEAEGNM